MTDLYGSAASVARQFADEMFSELSYADALIGMISELDAIAQEHGADELQREAVLIVAIEAFARRWQERRDQ